MRAIKDRMVRSYRFLFSFSLYSSCFLSYSPFFFSSLFISFRFLISRRCLSCHRRRIEKKERERACRSHQKVCLQLFSHHTHTHTHRERERESSIDRFFFLPDVVVSVSHSFPFFSYIRLCRGDIFHLGG